MTRKPQPEGKVWTGPWSKNVLMGNDEFRTWLNACLDEPKLNDPLKDLDWTKVETPLDVDCYLAGGAWTLFYRDKATRDLYEKALSPPAPPPLAWWTKKVWKYSVNVWFFPTGIVKERHLDMFLRGVNWRKKTSGLPTRSLQDFLQLMIGLADKPPSAAFAKAFTKLFPDDRVEDRILVMSGRRSYMDAGRKNQTGYPPRGLLGSPWICKADRMEATAKMPVGVLYGPMVSVISSEVLGKKIMVLPKTKGNVPWTQRAQLGLATVDDDKDLLPLLPTITQEEWLHLTRDLVARKSTFEQERAKTADSLRNAACVAWP